jgi:hypothetical protein
VSLSVSKDSKRHSFAPILAAFAGLLGAVATAAAQDPIAQTGSAAGDSTNSGTLRLSQATIDCSVYGTGYVVVQGTTRCVRIRGRMRVHNVDPGYRGANYLPYAGTPGASLPGAMGYRPAARFWRR